MVRDRGVTIAEASYDLTCGALGVSRSGFHAWLIRPPSHLARNNEVIGAKVGARHEEAIAPMMRAVPGTTCWPAGYPAACTGSNSSCASKVFGRGRSDADLPRIMANARSSPARCSIRLHGRQA